MTHTAHTVPTAHRPAIVSKLVVLLIALFAIQALCWWQLRSTPPPMDIVSPPPGKQAVKALALGEDQVFFRILGMEVQTAGDLFGRFTALFHYDYQRLYHWWKLLDALDPTSNYIPTLASYYFGQTQFVPDTRYVVKYLREHAEGDIKNKWWWMVQAIYIANHKLHDSDMALEMAKTLEGHRELPIWVQQMPAFLYEQRGEMDAALAIMENIQANVKDIPQGELNFIEHFVKERTTALEKQMKSAEENK
jgi:hypothetical protein